MFCVLYRLVRAKFTPVIYNFANISKISGKYQLYSTFPALVSYEFMFSDFRVTKFTANN